MSSRVDLARESLRGRRPARSGPAHVIGVVSGRGGAGVSLVAAVLALRSRLAGHRTLLVDADPWLDVQRVWLGLPKGPSLEALRAGGAGPEALVTSISDGLDLLSFGAGEALEREQRTLVRRIPSIFMDRDVVVVDAGTRLESLERCLDLSVGSILVVSGADAIGLASTHALIKALRGRAEVTPSVVLNRVTEDEAAAGRMVLVEGARRFLGFEPEVTGYLPTDLGFRDRIASGATLPESLLGSSLTQQVAGLMPRLRPWRAA